MLNSPPEKHIYPHEIKPGDEFSGYEYNEGDSSLVVMCPIEVNEEGVPLEWGKRPLPFTPDYFTRRMTWQEQKEWYQSQIDMDKSVYQLNLLGLHTDLYSVGNAQHEMWNGWIATDWIEQLVSLENEDFIIAGVAPAPYGFSGCRNPVAFVIEYTSDGDRYWCHAEKDWIDDMREESKEFYETYIKEG